MSLAAIGFGTGDLVQAVRPFVTDDARIVSKGQLEIETYPEHIVGEQPAIFDWQLMLGYTFTEWFELIVGSPMLQPGGQVIQPKFLLYPSVPGSWVPGLAFGLGWVQDFRSHEVTEREEARYLIGIMTWRLPDDVLQVHLNVGPREGWSNIKQFRSNDWFWGIGFDWGLWFDLNWRVIGEHFRGDPLDPMPSQSSFQYGMRYLQSDEVNFDITFGQQLNPHWSSEGHSEFGNSAMVRVEHWVQVGIRLLFNTPWVVNPSAEGASGLWPRH
ncbi:MAG: hypothetical protein NZ480_07825 [Bdellovibrionaceae bacterium]|nr:hypothetical protein [Pseudobdellovibrionaceae bacterium]